VIAHVGGVPLEEVLPALPGAGALLLFTRAWLSADGPGWIRTTARRIMSPLL
jgi:hypothetical protein